MPSLSAIVAAILTAGAIWLSLDLWGGGSPEVTQRTAMLAVASASTTLLGFTFTQLGILVGLGGKQLIENMKNTGHFRLMVDHLALTCVLFFASLACAMMNLHFGDTIPHGQKIASCIFGAALVFLGSASIRFYRIVTTV